ncbi:DHH family phosphoesterase [Pacificimonas sp. WHA3]|uniref:DHH family phosphoesterase n=1 Tax=Pacificimonas pallii TaxID=2827236 RepID=A0ABS6SHP3_9SPHN|nr:DHH family phosphoesterase [Pacificimonas pallii]MBV7257856.1 DHH family phosphoesterase [Pacificimonas pallii]
MADYDVFNGDADGICALVQLRLAMPRETTLITGVKRDISLLQRVKARAGDRITVLDVSMRNNAAALAAALAAGADVFYADHHNAGDIPEHPALTAHIDTDARICTSLIVDRLLGGSSHLWAITAAFGDSLSAVALDLAASAGLGAADTRRLERLGTLINYNGYGTATSDLHFAPDALYLNLVRHASPLGFLSESADIFAVLEEGYKADMAAAEHADIIDAAPEGLILHLPDTAASRRVSGVYGNAIAQDHPERAHAILTDRPEGGYLVSVRAPVARRDGADRLCLQFETGGGRAGAAGINHLPEGDLPRFIAAFRTAF